MFQMLNRKAESKQKILVFEMCDGRKNVATMLSNASSLLLA